MDITGLIAVIGAFSIGPAIVYLRSRHRPEERKLELEARTGGSPSNNETKQLVEENKLLRERVENLESIVCSVDFELNQKLAKVIDEQRSLLLLPVAPAGRDPTPPPGQPGRPAGRSTAADSPALDRTATAMARSAGPATTTPGPGQVLAQ